MILQGPVFSIAPEHGAVARVSAETNCGHVVSPTKGVDAVYQRLRRYYEQWANGTLRSECNLSAVEKYDRKFQTGQIAEIKMNVIEPQKELNKAVRRLLVEFPPLTG